MVGIFRLLLTVELLCQSVETLTEQKALMVKFDNSHRTIDQKVDGAVDGQEQLVDAKKHNYRQIVSKEREVIIERLITTIFKYEAKIKLPLWKLIWSLVLTIFSGAFYKNKDKRRPDKNRVPLWHHVTPRCRQPAFNRLCCNFYCKQNNWKHS